jgi:hypothetical protein
MHRLPRHVLDKQIFVRSIGVSASFIFSLLSYLNLSRCVATTIVVNPIKCNLPNKMWRILIDTIYTDLYVYVSVFSLPVMFALTLKHES